MVLLGVVVLDTRVVVVPVPPAAVVADVADVVDVDGLGVEVDEVLVVTPEVVVCPRSVLEGGYNVVLVVLVVVVAAGSAWLRLAEPEAAAAIENPSTTAARIPEVTQAAGGQFLNQAGARDMAVPLLPGIPNFHL